jgi:hypothetical protein
MPGEEIRVRRGAHVAVSVRQLPYVMPVRACADGMFEQSSDDDPSLDGCPLAA